ncbi:hypothetical protein M2131_001545 [Polynucleobacter sphagniphilus]|uniref:hypothetical protein n=1 Tax=Polynucleobacter sphagniphilus TaxID=1743169 RepID=UPI0024730E35|nr:hypothetical protein [Polynucleobacter sphagniphilus]MDH6421604.1 hypothetical protein [Polynucleobacter sphagniphilus]
MKNIYTRPVLVGHNVPYKGKRYWVIQIDKDHPFENYENDCSYIVFDKECGCVISWCEKTDDGSFKGYIQYVQGSIDVDGKTPKELVNSVIRWSNWIERTEK